MILVSTSSTVTVRVSSQPCGAIPANQRRLSVTQLRIVTVLSPVCGFVVATCLLIPSPIRVAGHCFTSHNFLKKLTMLGSVRLLSQLIHDVDDIGSGFLPKTTAMRAPSPVLTRLVQRAAVSRTSKPSNVESVRGYSFPALLGPSPLSWPLPSHPSLA
ncbi:uncharacterized protein B0T23DRAFT_92442 [Neurospora hispaniola]|uniref:Uncharacterized protein n=1 Tax=Neurospora hispaniola TaxID=588809 RepID=A0AAJ0IDH5_9PEZI|nr:hypothetical protein B0T23DRAFT_92442 [Neurospora hispaniola]